MALIQSVDRALRILFTVAGRPDGVGVRELARLNELTPPTTQNLLKTLQQHGMVRFDPANRRYCLGAGAMQLSGGQEQLSNLQQQLHQALVGHVQRTGAPAVAATFRDGDVLLIDAVKDLNSATPFRPQIVQAPHIMGAGLAVLAQLDAPTREAWSRRMEADELASVPLDRVWLAGVLTLAGQDPDHAVLRLPLPRYASVALGLPVLGAPGGIPLGIGTSWSAAEDSPERRASLRASLRLAIVSIGVGASTPFEPIG